MIPEYNPTFLDAYHFSFLSFGLQDLASIILILWLLYLYRRLARVILPNYYVMQLQKMSIREVQKAKLKREYIEEFERVV